MQFERRSQHSTRLVWSRCLASAIAAIDLGIGSKAESQLNFDAAPFFNHVLWTYLAFKQLIMAIDLICFERRLRESHSKKLARIYFYRRVFGWQ
jgi:hypothetical protein